MSRSFEHRARIVTAASRRDDIHQRRPNKRVEEADISTGNGCARPGTEVVNIFQQHARIGTVLDVFLRRSEAACLCAEAPIWRLGFGVMRINSWIAEAGAPEHNPIDQPDGHTRQADIRWDQEECGRKDDAGHAKNHAVGDNHGAPASPAHADDPRTLAIGATAQIGVAEPLLVTPAGQCGRAT